MMSDGTKKEESKKDEPTLLEKIQSNIREELKHRSKSTFIASYIISFIIINWKAFLYVLFVDKSLEHKLNSHYTKCDGKTLLLPIAGVLLYMIVVPFIEKIFNIISNLVNRPLDITISIQQQQEQSRKLENELKLESLRNQLYSAMSEQGELKNLSQTNQYLKEQNEIHQQNLNFLMNTIEKLRKQIEELEEHDVYSDLGQARAFRKENPEEIAKFSKIFKDKSEIKISDIETQLSNFLITNGLMTINERWCFEPTEFGYEVIREYNKSLD